MSNVKHRGQVFTPINIVNLMLDKIEYCDDNIQCNSILEPSFGDGAFLCEIINRIIDYSALYNLTKSEIYEILDNVYGIELDVDLYTATIEKLNAMLHRYGLDYNWPHLYNMDALQYNPDVQFDYIVGNPPYVKIQNLGLDVRKCLADNYQFCSGNTDLYIAFFEKFIPMLKNSGQLAFITPNSYFKNTSQKEFRSYLIEGNYVSDIIDYGSYKVFDNADTYTAITFLRKSKTNKHINYQLMNNITDEKYSISIHNSFLNHASWVFPSKEGIDILRNNSLQSVSLGDICTIQHGISTNADRVYIVTPEHFNEFEPEMLRPVIKASTLNKSNKIIFPYQWNDKEKRYDVLPEDLMQKKYPKTYTYLEQHKDVLLNRNMEKDALWYQYARSQGLNNSNAKKLVLKHVTKSDGTNCSVELVDKDTLVYSGIYIVVHDVKKIAKIKRILSGSDFYQYALITGKDMSNGYKTLNTKIIKEFKYK